MPLANEVHIDSAMTGVSLAYKNAQAIAEQVLPVVTVAKQSDKYFIFDRTNFRQDKTHRAPGTPAKEVTYSVTNGTYSCDNLALEGIVTDEEIANADSPLIPRMDMTEYLMEKITIDEEIKAAALLFTTTGFSLNVVLTGTNQWSDYAASDPFSAVETGMDAVMTGCGLRPNTIIMGHQVYSKLKFHPDIVDRIKYTGRDNATPGMMASLLDVQNVIVGDAVYNSAVEGLTESMGFIWGKYCLLAYIEPRPGIKRPSLGYTMRWGARVTETWRDEHRKGDFVRVNQYLDQKIVATSCVYVIKDAVA